MKQEVLVRKQLLCCIAVAAFLKCGAATALNPALSIKELHHTAWGPGQSAPLGGAIALAQTTDGYLWIAGPSGLVRFDGIAMERVELPHDPKLSSVGLCAAFAARNGGLWVGFTYGGVAFLKGGRWQVFSSADGVPSGSPWQFAEAGDGTLWLATTTDLARFDGIHWKAVGAEMGVPASTSPQLFVDSQGAIWAGGGNALFLLRPGERRFHQQPVAAPPPWLGIGMAEAQDGTVWLDAGYDLVPVARNPPHATALRSSAGDFAFDHDGVLWASLEGLHRIVVPEHAALGASLHVDSMMDAYSEVDGLTSRTVFSLLVDLEGNVWTGTTHGFDRFSDPSLEAPLQSAENLKVVPHVVAAGMVPADEAGGLWITNGIDAVTRYQKGKLGAPIISQKVTSLVRTADGTVWFGGEKALWSIRQGQLLSVATPPAGRITQSLAQDKSGDLWASFGLAGVFRLKDGTWTQNGGIPALSRSWVITIARDRRDRLWFAYPDGSVASLDDARVSVYDAHQGLQIGNVMAIHSGRIGNWFGGEFGLARLEGERFRGIPSAPDLPLDGITGLVESADGDLWINDRAGIVRIASTELERNRSDPAYPVRGETLGAFDGIIGSASIIRPLPTAIEAADGKIWFATSGGIFGIDPARRIHNRLPPTVLVTGLNVLGRTIDPESDLKLPSRTVAVRFDYTAPSLTAAEKVRYRYKLDGVDVNWRAPTAARQALYTSLLPGRYNFHVIAANNDGVWNESGASIAFVIPPTFTQTRWFIALCVLIGVVVVWALVRLRIRQVARRVRLRLEERMEERLNERTRISRELHDSLLQGFQGLMFRLQAVRQLLPSGEAASVLDSAMEVGDQAIDQGRNAVHDLRSLSLAERDFSANLNQLESELGARTALHRGKPEYRVTFEGRARELSSAVLGEAHRITREAVSNAYQHAHATHIEVAVSYSDAELSIRVSDDGIGMDPEVLARGQRAGHWGLPGMRERSAALGARLDIQSEANAGTQVTLRIPARAAYERNGGEPSKA